ncbi:unnamed protein product [Protopolystoma xenopodis]|uniref:phosphopyruvate hydratase n=1 Tax=Protopolystoma xenopodis TaxID=117903 RepID=A0A3S4ZIX5_9PLAT|nr:unnamed protein product [Protopolystoma xenopodis]
MRFRRVRRLSTGGRETSLADYSGRLSLECFCRARPRADIPVYRHVANLSGTKRVMLPAPAFNVINGGVHAGNKMAFQELMVMPVGAKSFSEALRMGSEVYHHLKERIKQRYGLDACNVGDEGGFAPNILDVHEGEQPSGSFYTPIVIRLDDRMSHTSQRLSRLMWCQSCRDGKVYTAGRRLSTCS